MPTRYRDAATGEYVTEGEAKKRPRETVKETDKKPPAKPQGKKLKGPAVPNHRVGSMVSQARLDVAFTRFF